ncbi:Ltp family lipoprotein [uncultured Corynebacterium sp.]|uniref:Ltp family lipoprotein n=1 Tax=uncultured Corynebacterium sp. TaxID=159447 RepID=UPI00288A70AC|nr:Ltp family lipoprotein [uncultured Corynebacterium sp.]
MSGGLAKIGAVRHPAELSSLTYAGGSLSCPTLMQLTSEYGEQFTMEEAQHAVSTLGL